MRVNQTREDKLNINDGSYAINAIEQGMIKQHGADKVKKALIVAKLQSQLTEVLADRRIDLEISQVELASKIDSSQKQISRYERNEQAPSIGKLIEWCLELDVDLVLTNKTDNNILFHT